MWQTRLAWLAALLLATLVQAAENATDIYELPSFSLVLNVDKSQNELIVFQDRLDDAVEQHLNAFFQQKIEGASLPNGSIQDVLLTSAYVWKELSHSTDNDNSPNKYEVRAQFNCQLEVGYNPQSTSGAVEEAKDVLGSRISESIMELFLIEAFQGDNYWSLVHAFFKDAILDSITGMKITVQADGYVHSNSGGQDHPAVENTQTSGAWTAAMIVGVCFATICLGMMIIMWTYLCCCARDSVWVRLNRRKRHPQKNTRRGDKPDSTTDDSHSTSSRHHEEEENEYSDQMWMDAWAKSITSIPLRAPVKPRKLKKAAASIRRPGHHHNSNLNAIVEADDDSSTVCSIETRQSHSTSQHSRKPSKQDAIMESEATEVEEGQYSIQESDEQSDDDESVSSSTTYVSPTQRKGSRKNGSIV